MKWLVIIVILVVLGAGAWLAKEYYSPYRGYSGRLVLVIPPGTRATTVAERLVQHGVLHHRVPFLIRYWLGRRRHETLKFGEYLFDRPLSVSEVYWKIARGEVYLHAVVIPEGSDRFEMARILHQAVGLNAQQFLSATEDPAPIKDLDPQAPSLEGYLFPDTYRFPRGVSVAQVVSTMLARFRDVMNSQIHPEAPPDATNLHRTITLASLVEKETPDPGERPRVAGVFTRRLEKGMLLECDPTVIYALRLSHSPADLFKGPITRSDLAVNSPYNTYTHSGLPPGPICSPGLASIRAALHPAQGSALYFVSNNHGGHYFANTLAEHYRNVERSRRDLKEMQQKGSHAMETPSHATR
ncbi:MAG TPA: endolytic transglycosylase MltG [Terriglobia bacterium]|nr:endolytic transglycosylase MltG [Terriglobia bacterium]